VTERTPPLIHTQVFMRVNARIQNGNIHINRFRSAIDVSDRKMIAADAHQAGTKHLPTWSYWPVRLDRADAAIRLEPLHRVLVHRRGKALELPPNMLWLGREFVLPNQSLEVHSLPA